MRPELIGVDGVDDEATEPDGLTPALGHDPYLASSRRELRYFLAACAATFNARSVSGS